MRTLTDTALGRRQADFLAHGSIEKGARIRLGRPHALVEAGDQYPVGLDQARFKRTQYFKPRMRVYRATQGYFRNDATEKGGVT